MGEREGVATLQVQVGDLLSLHQSPKGSSRGGMMSETTPEANKPADEAPVADSTPAAPPAPPAPPASPARISCTFPMVRRTKPSATMIF